MNAIEEVDENKLPELLGVDLAESGAKRSVEQQMSRVPTKRFPPYPKIFALGSRGTENILSGSHIQITEKVDGSQFAFGKLDGRLRCRSKGQEIHIDSPDKMFEEGVEYVKSIEGRLPEGMVFYCEYLRKPKHNVLAYDNTPLHHLALFAVSDDDTFVTRHSSLRAMAAQLDISVVDVIYEGSGDNVTPEDVLGMIDRVSGLGGQNVEGVVIKKFEEILIGGQLLPVTSAKYVSEKFKEVHSGEWAKENTAKGKWDVWKMGFQSEARWNKAVQHLKEAGTLDGSPRDIGKLMKEVKEDIVAEEKEAIKDKLWKEFSGDLLRFSTRGLAEWYKEKLVLELGDADET